MKNRSCNKIQYDNATSNQNHIFICTRLITPKRVTSGGAHIRGVAPGLHGSERRSGGKPLATLCRFDNS